MTLLSTVLLALAMSTDAFAAAIARGATMYRPRWSDALRVGVVFGVIETLTPLIGWLLGMAAASYVEAWDHWIAFTVLCGLGLHMIWQAWTGEAPDEGTTRSRIGWVMVLTALGTSIDAMAVGVGLAFMQADIILTSLAIGAATFGMVALGTMLGRVLGSMAGRAAAFAGGVVLIGIGATILRSHLG